MSRDYSRLSLPYTVSAWKVPLAIREIVAANMWTQLPYDLAVKINLANNQRQDLVITAADLDSLPDDVWNYLQSRLG